MVSFGRRREEKEALRTGRKDQRTRVVYGLVAQEVFFLSLVALLARRSTMWKLSDLPMNQDTSSPIKPLLYEGIAGGKILNDIFVFHVIDFDDVVPVIHEEIAIKRQSQHGYYMCNVGLVQGFFPAQGEKSVVGD